MRFDFKVTFPHPELQFIRLEAVLSVRAFDGDDDSLILKSRDPHALDKFMEVTGIEGLRLPKNPYRSTKIKVPKNLMIKAATFGFPNQAGMTVEFQNAPYGAVMAPKPVFATSEAEEEVEGEEEDDENHGTDE